MADTTAASLILAGFGSSSALQITVETQQLAVQVGHVLALGLPERTRMLFARAGVEVEQLDELLEGVEFAEGYAAVAHAVLARASNEPPAMFVSQGSPLFLNAITRFLAAEAARLELKTRILPGVSPVDVVVAELGVDVARSGLQTLGAVGFARKPGLVNPRVPLLLLEVAGVGAPSGSPEAYGPLVEALRQVYPQEQPVTLLNLPGNGSVTRATVRLERIGELLTRTDNSSSLFIDVVRKTAQPTTPTSTTATEGTP